MNFDVRYAQTYLSSELLAVDENDRPAVGTFMTAVDINRDGALDVIIQTASFGNLQSTTKAPLKVWRRCDESGRRGFDQRELCRRL